MEVCHHIARHNLSAQWLQRCAHDNMLSCQVQQRQLLQACASNSMQAKGNRLRCTSVDAGAGRGGAHSNACAPGAL
jgi:hypothetical protein